MSPDGARSTSGPTAAVGLLVLAALTAVPVSAQRPETDPAPSVYLTVLAGSLNIRQGPALDAPVVGGAVRGQTLCVLGFSDDWAEVRTATVDPEAPATSGYVSRGFVSETRATPEELRRKGCGD